MAEGLTMTELGFLMDLFLEEELPKEIKLKIKERIKEVEQGFNAQASLVYKPMIRPSDDVVQIQPAVSQAAQAALQQRAEVIAKAGKVEPGRTSPRKF
jgi:hypothetical protein